MNDNIEMVTVPLWKMERAANVLENDGDESGVARDIRYMIKGSPKPEAQAAGDAELLQLLLDAAHALDPLGYARGSEQEHEKLAARLDAKRFAMKAALSTPASHDAQQPSSAMVKVALRNLPQYISKCSLIGPDKHSAMLCFETLRDALAQQPAVVGDFDEWYASYDGIGGPKNPEQLARDAWERAAALTSAATPGYEGHLCGGLGFIPGPEGTGTEFDAQCPDCAATPGEQKGDGDV